VLKLEDPWALLLSRHLATQAQAAVVIPMESPTLLMAMPPGRKYRCKDRI
jgi:hypothetical protein